MKKIFLFFLLSATSLLIYWSKKHLPEYPLFLRHLFYAPIILGGLFYGVSGGIIISLIATFVLIPVLLANIEKLGINFQVIECVITLFIFFALGITSGLLFQKSKEEKKFYKSLYDIEAILNRNESLNKILEKINEIFSAFLTSIIMINKKRIFIITQSKGKGIEETKNVILKKDNLISKIIENKIAFLSNNLSTDFRIKLPGEECFNFNSLCIAPLSHKNNVFGAILFAKEENISLEDFNLFKTIAKNLSLNFYNKKLHAFSIIDDLTGIFNRYYFDQKIEHKISSAKEKSPLSLVIIDIDFFKKINDRFGHLAGDEVLKKIAKIIKNYSPPNSVYRIGGEEFAILLANTKKEEAFTLAERIRVICKKYYFFLASTKKTVTISGGIASCPEDATTSNELIKYADYALYKAKREGRDKICLYQN